MNVRRGLFRLWILLSAIWVVTCVSVAALDGLPFLGARRVQARLGKIHNVGVSSSYSGL
jgi:hypothetical protein